MIRFQCTACLRKLSVADELAGKLAVCPSCRTKLRIPTAKKKPEPVEPIDEEDEDLEEEETEKGPWFNANRIRGLVAIAFAIGILIFALTFEKFRNPGDFAFGEYGTPVG